MSNIENSICEAIELIVNKSVREAGYDKTIQAVVQSCADASIGKYKVTYQDSSFYAYATNADVTYSNGSTVYILVPGNDMNKDKTILGTVDKLGINYVTKAEGDEAYDINGNNCITSSNTYKISSYATMDNDLTGFVKVIYTPEKAASYLSDFSDDIKIDMTALQQYIKESSSLVCGAVFKTALSAEQQYQGNYGIVFGLDFYDNSKGNAKGDIVTRYYTVDVDNMTGNPYNLKLGKRQYGIFDIDGANFDKISSISLFVKDFPNHKTDEEIAQQNLYDITVSQIEVAGATIMSEDELNGCSISFVTPDGKFFPSTALDDAELRITANVKMKGKIVNAKLQKIPFYWFQEDLSIVAQSERYNKYGGRGWRCLNNYNVIEEATSENARQVEWIPYEDTYAVKIANVHAYETKFKCAILYDGAVYSKTITIRNLKNTSKITIESDLGTKFYYDIGRPTLTCYVDKKDGVDYVEPEGVQYIWAVEDAYGNLTNLPVDPEQNRIDCENYEKAVVALKKLQDEIAAGTRFPNEAANELSQKQAAVDAFKNTQCVAGKELQRVAVNEITNLATYKCSVIRGSECLGTASIVLTNSFETEDTYTLVINNGTQTYQYDEYGVSPASSATDNPIQIPTLTFSVFDNLGNPLDGAILKSCDIKWKIPIKNTMLTNIRADGTPGAPDAAQEYQYYLNSTELAYGIQNKYYYNYKNNDIELTVNYKGMNLTAKTNLTFVKQGESGTNGTSYTCKIVPNSNQDKLPLYPTLTMAKDSQGNFTSGYFNFKHRKGDANNIYIGSGESSVAPFVIKLYKAGEEIFSGSQSGQTQLNETGESTIVTVEWEILQNHYTSSISDASDLTINKNNGKIKYTGNAYRNMKIPANIIKCTVYYDNKQSNQNNGRYSLYATMPIIIARVENSKYQMNLKENSGFRYVTYTSDGTVPKYDTTHPFEIEVLEKINGVNEVVSCIEGPHSINDFTWDKVGQVFKYAKNKQKMENTEDLIHQNSSVYISKWKPNQRGFKPNPHYDGLCVTNAVVCRCSIGSIHIPIHFLLNKYGLAELNGWDGNSIQINKDGGYIISPEMGAGKKESDNSFTGVLMGEVQEPNRTFSDIGLLGYNKGNRSFYLNAKDGSASFGSGQAQILIDPTSGIGLLYSTNYYKQYTEDGKPINYGSGNLNGEGLLIDLTTPEIKFGNGNFSVDKNGYLTAKGGGSIAGWNIDDDSLFTGNKSDANNVRISSANFSRSINNVSRSRLRIALGTKFAVSADGTLYAGDAIVGTGTNKITIGKSYSDGNQSAIYSGSKTGKTTNASGFYIGTDGIGLGNSEGGVSNFQVDADGRLYARKGYIGDSRQGWTIEKDCLRNGKYGYSDGYNGVYLGTDGIGLGAGKFYVTKNGNLHSTSGDIGGWHITSSSLSNDGYGNESGYWDGSGMYFGTSGIRLGSTFSVNASGKLTATSGSIGGWSLSSNRLSAGSMNIWSDGSMDGPNWSISAGGRADFSNIYINGGQVKLGGTTMTGGGGTYLSSGSTSVGYGGGSYGLAPFVKMLAVDSLNVSGSLTFQGRSCRWQSIKVITNRSMSWTNVYARYGTSITWNGPYQAPTLNKDQQHKFCANLSSTSYYRTLWILTAASGEWSEGD